MNCRQHSHQAIAVDSGADVSGRIGRSELTEAITSLAKEMVSALDREAFRAHCRGITIDRMRFLREICGEGEMESKVAAGFVGGLEDLRWIEGKSDARPDASALIIFPDPSRSYWWSSLRAPPLDLGAYLLERRRIRDTKLCSRLEPPAARVRSSEIRTALSLPHDHPGGLFPHGGG